MQMRASPVLRDGLVDEAARPGGIETKRQARRGNHRRQAGEPEIDEKENGK
jgi:hypothetical protein